MLRVITTNIDNGRRRSGELRKSIETISEPAAATIIATGSGLKHARSRSIWTTSEHSARVTTVTMVTTEAVTRGTTEFTEMVATTRRTTEVLSFFDRR